MTYPSYINLLKSGELAKRVGIAYRAMKSCKLCPRECGVNRLNDELGFCKSGKIAKVASANLHHGEEPPISGTKGPARHASLRLAGDPSASALPKACRAGAGGSGTIFFANCNLGCKFCQNYPISHLGNGKNTTPNELASMMLKLQKRGAHNINLVTPSHVIPQFLAGLLIAAKKGLNVPIVYNSSGYDAMGTLDLLDGIVDIYMPDIKYSSDVSAKNLSNAENYCKINRLALTEMFRQVGVLRCSDDGIATRGLLIRHLILPNDLAGSAKCFEFISKNLGHDIPVNLMSQYFPAFKAENDPILGRQITTEEFQKAKKVLLKQGLNSGWIQEI